MKKLKNKSLIGLAVLAMAGAGLVACGPKKDDEPKVKSPLEEAAYYIDQIYQSDEGKVKSADFDRISKYVDDQDREFTIDWSVTIVTSGAPATSVQVVPGKNKKGEDDANLSKIDIDEESDLDVDFTLSGVIHYGEDSLNLATLNLKMPKLHIATWEEYVEACAKSGSSAGDSKNTALSVEGIVTTIIGAANGNTTNAIYLQDVSGKGSYYAYKLADDPATKVQKGQKVRVSGETGLYSGTYEILNPSITKVYDDAPVAVTPVDYTTKFASATALTDPAITSAQGLYVEIKDVTITDEDIANGYFKFKKGTLESYVRISSSVCPISKEAQNAMKAAHAEKTGWIADVKGIINLFNGGFYLTPIDAEPFNFKSLPELSDADSVAFEKNILTTKTEIVTAGDVTLPTAGASYTGVSIAWASDNAEVANVTNGKVTYTLPAGIVDVKLTATLTKGTASDTKEFTVKVVGQIPWKTVAEVKELEKDIANATDSTDTYYVYGQIMDEPTADYCNFTLKSGDEEILVYGLYTKDDNSKRYGTKRDVAEIPFKVGDMFYCKAHVQNYNGKWELTKAIEQEVPAPGSHPIVALNPTKAIEMCEALDGATKETSTDKYFITGVIGTDPTADYCNFDFVVGEKHLIVYGLYTVDGTERYGSKRQVAEIPFKKGDTITVKGNLQNYEGKLEVTNAWLVSFSEPVIPSVNYKGVKLAWDAANYAEATEGVVAATNGESSGIKFSTVYNVGTPGSGSNNWKQTAPVAKEDGNVGDSVVYHVNTTEAATGLKLRMIVNRHPDGTWEGNGTIPALSTVSGDGTKGYVWNEGESKWDASPVRYKLFVNDEEVVINPSVEGYVEPKLQNDAELTVELPCEIDLKAGLNKIELQNYGGYPVVICGFELESGAYVPEHAGTEADPYSIKDALGLSAKMSKSTSKKDANTEVYVNTYGDVVEGYFKGVVTTEGTYNTKKFQQNFKLSDAGSEKDILVYSANLNDDDRFYLNDEVVVKGYLMNYNGTIEISNFVTYKDGGTAEKPGKVEDVNTRAVVTAITAGKSAVTLGAHEGATVTGMPTEAVTNGTTVSNVVVAADEGKVVKAVRVNGVAIEAVDGKYSFTVNGPAELTVVTEDANAAPVTTTDVTMSFAARAAETKSEIKQENALAYFKACLPSDKADLLTAVTVSKIYDGNSSGGWKSGADSNGYIKSGTGSANGVLTFTFDESVQINKVVLSAHSWTDDTSTAAPDTISVNGSAAQETTKGSAPEAVTFELDAATNTITITFAKRCFVNSIVFSVIDK